ncbi:hypothetical protein VDG1235_2784 [Verrucomicrobiia bacterium DG1235]|nr:hypothetical protein VDG1235_2784 [Verrucomicrobiae bacterium DG1235]
MAGDVMSKGWLALLVLVEVGFGVFLRLIISFAKEEFTPVTDVMPKVIGMNP